MLSNREYVISNTNKLSNKTIAFAIYWNNPTINPQRNLTIMWSPAGVQLMVLYQYEHSYSKTDEMH
jgi:hypothetical protein